MPRDCFYCIFSKMCDVMILWVMLQTTGCVCVGTMTKMRRRMPRPTKECRGQIIMAALPRQFLLDSIANNNTCSSSSVATGSGGGMGWPAGRLVAGPRISSKLSRRRFTRNPPHRQLAQVVSWTILRRRLVSVLPPLASAYHTNTGQAKRCLSFDPNEPTVRVGIKRCCR